MSKGDVIEVILDIVALGCVAFMMFACWSLSGVLQIDKQQALELGYKQYNPQTGQLEWVDPCSDCECSEHPHLLNNEQEEK